MSIYYIFTQDGNIYELDATREIVVSSTGKLSEHPLSNLNSASDHYINHNDMFQLEGTISDIKSAASGVNGVPTQDFIIGLKNIKNNKQSFRLVYGASQVGDFSTVFAADGCFFESLVFKQNNRYGHFKGINSFEVSMTIKKTKLASQTTLEILTGELVEDVVEEAPPAPKGGSTEEVEYETISVSQGPFGVVSQTIRVPKPKGG